jgi:hypothetical protein
MLHIVNTICWFVLSGVGVTAYQMGELDSTGEIVLTACVALTAWNLYAAICQ